VTGQSPCGNFSCPCASRAARPESHCPCPRAAIHRPGPGAGQLCIPLIQTLFRFPFQGLVPIRPDQIRPGPAPGEIIFFYCQTYHISFRVSWSILPAASTPGPEKPIRKTTSTTNGSMEHYSVCPTQKPNHLESKQ